MARTAAHLDPRISDDPRAIRAQIRHTRASINQTVNEIQARLSPNELKQQAQTAVREATLGKVENMATDAKQSWRRTVRQNPAPLALIGLGLGWLLLSDNDKDDSDYYRQSRSYDPRYYSQQPSQPSGWRETYQNVRENVADTVSDVRESIAETADSMRESINETADNVRESAADVRDQAQDYAQHAQYRASRQANYAQNQASDYANQAQEQAGYLRWEAEHKARRAKRNIMQTIEEQPIAVGAVALAAGALIGMSLPATQFENELIGETSDQVMETIRATAEEKAQEALNSAQTVASQTLSTAKKATKSEIKQTS